MTPAIDRDRDSLNPALAGSAILHLAAAALFMISWPWARELKVGAVVPVKIVTNAPTTDVRPAVQAPEEQAAAAEAPVPDESLQAPASPEPKPAPEPVPPAPPPKPAPPPPKPAVPAPKPAPVPEKAPPAKPQAAAQAAAKPAERQEVDLDKLLASVSKAARPAGSPKSAAPRGPTRAETAPQARPAVGTGLAANAVRGLTEELQRRWNPNCEVEGGRDVQVRVTFTLGANGDVVGEVSAGGEERSGNAVVQTAAERAIRAVYAAAPFRTLPREFYGERIAVRFNAREACS